MRSVVISVAAALATLAPGRAASPPPALKLSISIAQPTVATPFATRVTLHFHNASTETLWLYRPVESRSAVPKGSFENYEQVQPRGGSNILVSLAPAGVATTAIVSPASGKTLAATDMPQPDLISLAPGQDAEEDTIIEFTPAEENKDGKDEPFWGGYSMTVTYGASFPNAGDLASSVGVQLWQGSLKSNSAPLRLNPPSGSGKVEGNIFDRQKQPVYGAVVSLEDGHLNLLDQKRTGASGSFRFTGLPAGEYCVVARHGGATVETGVVRHFEINPSAGNDSMQLMMLPKEIYQGKQMVHEPVLLRVTNAAGTPLPDVTLRMLSAPMPVVENDRARTDSGGLAYASLIPGSVYITLERRGCRKQDTRIDVSTRHAVDGYALSMNCR